MQQMYNRETTTSTSQLKTTTENTTLAGVDAVHQTHGIAPTTETVRCDMSSFSHTPEDGNNRLYLLPAHQETPTHRMPQQISAITCFLLSQRQHLISPSITS